ncbi:glycolate oxidase subunit GlcE [Alcaligenaceae bacterium CGII-47]|nr:glycolate oxidase subunit GlcE [Alcaligenaceae bacterium CGII-47]
MQFVLSELSEQVVTARAAQRPVYIRGGATRQFYGEPFPDTVASGLSWLDISSYHGIVSYEPSELVLTAYAGTRLSEIEQALDERGQMLAFEPPRFGEAGTLGGCVASGMSGPRRMAAGPLSDFILGTKLLDANGNILRFGGEVMKNVAGYDLSRLLAGSLGTLGALVEVSVKVIPKPQFEMTQVLEMSEQQALDKCQQWRGRPLPLSATAWQAGAEGSLGQLHVRLSGNQSAVVQSSQTIGGESLREDIGAAFWCGLRDQTHTFFQSRPLWRVVVPPGTPALGVGPTLVEWHGGLRWVAAPAAHAADLRQQVQAVGGSASLYRYTDRVPEQGVFHPLDPALMQIHRRLKAQFDPAGLFNPNRLYSEF